MNDFYFVNYVIIAAFWKDRKNRRNFFENYAKENGFDPLVPDNWYKHPYINISQIKVLSNIFLLFYVFYLKLLLSGSKASFNLSWI